MASELGLQGSLRRKEGAPRCRQGQHGVKVQKAEKVKEGQAWRGSFRPTDAGQVAWNFDLMVGGSQGRCGGWGGVGDYAGCAPGSRWEEPS